MGTASDFDGNTLLVENETVLIPQSKEMIEDSQLVFHPNNEGKYEDIRLFYRGSNIRSVTVSGKESTVYYENLDTVTDMVDVFSFYYPVEDADEDFDAEADFTARWNSGEFDAIRNVYFNGLNVEEINRIRRDQSKKIGYITAALTIDDRERNVVNLDHYEKVKGSRVEVSAFLRRPNNLQGQKKASHQLTLLPEPVTVEGNEDSFLYRYEKLFYKSRKAALATKDNFTYEDLITDELTITVTYHDGTQQDYQVTISFDKQGNLICQLFRS